MYYLFLDIFIWYFIFRFFFIFYFLFIFSGNFCLCSIFSYDNFECMKYNIKQLNLFAICCILHCIPFMGTFVLFAYAATSRNNFINYVYVYLILFNKSPFSRALQTGVLRKTFFFVFCRLHYFKYLLEFYEIKPTISRIRGQIIQCFILLKLLFF